MTGTGHERPATTRHEPGRPGWRCQACAADWPCAAAKAELLAAPSRVRVALDLAREFGEAILVEPDVPVSIHYQRFLGWLHDPPGWLP